MKYKVGDTVLVQGKVAQLDIRDYSLRLEFEDEVSAWFGEHEIFELPKPDKTYEDGLQDAWNLAKKIALESSNGGFDVSEIVKIFGFNDMDAIFMSYTPQQALAKLKAYEEAHEIKVGDVVEHEEYPYLITYTHGNILRGISKDGIGIVLHINDDVKKTGNHIDIAGLLEQIKGE